MKTFSEHLSAHGLSTPQWHIVLGSTFGDSLEGPEGSISPDWTLAARLPFSEVKGLFASSAPGHRGEYRFFKNKKTGSISVFQLGRLHGFEGHSALQVTQTVMQSRMAGTPHFILTNAAGSLRADFGVGSVMMLQDHVNLTGQNPLVGKNPVNATGKELGPRFPDLENAYDPTLRKKLGESFKKAGLATHEGTYLGLLGPSFETPAEIRLFSKWGLDAVGMSTVWETIALRHSGAKVVGLSLISNLGCGLGPPIDHMEILKNCAASAKKTVSAIFGFLNEV